MNSSAAWVYIHRGALLPALAVPAILGVMLGSRLGASLLARTPASVVRRVVIVGAAARRRPGARARNGAVAVSREQVVQELYARWLGAVARIAFAASLVAFVLYAGGVLPTFVPLDALPALWQLPVGEYLARTGAPVGWGWLRLLRLRRLPEPRLRRSDRRRDAGLLPRGPADAA